MKLKTVHEMEVVEQKADLVSETMEQVKLMAQAVMIGALAISLLARFVARVMRERIVQEEKTWYADGRDPDDDIGF